MTLKSLKAYFVSSLLDYYPETEILSFFYLLSQHILEMRRIDVSLNHDIKISKNDEEAFQNSIDKLKKQEPIQYIIGETEFYGLPFKVNDSVLIPRPETEELVDWIISKFRIQNSEFRILDIGTGSGCIAIALASNLPNVKILALDISKKALQIAKFNAELNNVNVEFIEANILKWQQETGIKNLELEDLKLDVIVSNPPYVRALEKEKMSTNVLNHEPHLALFVEDNNPLLFYREIIHLARKVLRKKGELFFEINEYLGKELVRLLNDEGFVDVVLKTDIFGKDRMIKGIKF